MDREIASLIAFGAEALGSSLRALHSTVSSDVGSIRRVSTAWPSYVLDLEERRDEAQSHQRRRYSPKQLERAERVCSLFVAQEHYGIRRRRCAVVRSLNPNMTWRDVASHVNAFHDGRAEARRLAMLAMAGTLPTSAPPPAERFLSWQECRHAHDEILASFAYVVCQAEGLEVRPVVARSRELAS